MGGGRAEEPADVIVADITERLEQAELVAAVVTGPEGDDGFKRRTTGDAAGHLGHKNSGGGVELEAAPRPALDAGDGVERVGTGA